MADPEGETIIITAQRQDGSSSSWMALVTKYDRSSGAFLGQITQANFARELKSLTKSDQVKIVFQTPEGPVEVLVRDLGGRDIAKALGSLYSVIAGSLDGSLMASVQSVPNSATRDRLIKMVNEIKDDLESAAKAKHPLLFTGEQYETQGGGVKQSGEYLGRHNELVDINGDGHLGVLLV